MRWNYIIHMATENRVNIGSGNGTKQLPEPMLTDHQLTPVTFILGQLHNRCLGHQSIKSIWKAIFKISFKFPRCQWVKAWCTNISKHCRAKIIRKIIFMTLSLLNPLIPAKLWFMMWWYFTISVCLTRCHACFLLNFLISSLFAKSLLGSWYANSQSNGTWGDKLAPLWRYLSGKQFLWNTPLLRTNIWSYVDLVYKSRVWYV